MIPGVLPTFSQQPLIIDLNQLTDPNMKPLKHGLYFCGVFGILLIFLFLISTGKQLYQQSKTTNNGLMGSVLEISKSAQHALSSSTPSLQKQVPDLESLPNLPDIQAIQNDLSKNFLNNLTNNEGFPSSSSAPSNLTPKIFNKEEIQQLQDHAEEIKKRLKKQSDQLQEFTQ